jgi:hypothetical protein
MEADLRARGPPRSDDPANVSCRQDAALMIQEQAESKLRMIQTPVAARAVSGLHGTFHYAARRYHGRLCGQIGCGHNKSGVVLTRAGE